MITAGDKLEEIEENNATSFVADVAFRTRMMIFTPDVKSIELNEGQANTLEEWVLRAVPRVTEIDRLELAGRIATWLNSLGIRQHH